MSQNQQRIRGPTKAPLSGRGRRPPIGSSGQSQQPSQQNYNQQPQRGGNRGRGRGNNRGVGVNQSGYQQPRSYNQGGNYGSSGYQVKFNLTQTQKILKNKKFLIFS